MARRGVRTGFEIWRESELPFFEKSRLALKNQIRKVVRARGCCGHPGEPGC